MVRRRSVLVLAAVAAALASWPGAALPAGAKVRIGLAVPLTGRMAAHGLAIKSAIEAAIAETNAAGGVMGQTLALAVEDDGCAQATAEGAARALLSQAPRLVIGHPCSNAAAHAAALYASAGVLFIAVGARHPAVTRTAPSGLVLRLAGRDDRQGEAAARWLLARSPGRRVAIIQDRTAYARALSERASAALTAAGSPPLIVLPIIAGRHEYAETALRLAASGAEAVFFAGYPEEGAIVLANLDTHGPHLPFLGSDALATEAFAAAASRSQRSVEVLLPAEPLPAQPGLDAVSARARGALEIWMRAAAVVGSVDPSAVAAHIKTAAEGIDTPSLGPVRFDAEGDLIGEAFRPAAARAGLWHEVRFEPAKAQRP